MCHQAPCHGDAHGDNFLLSCKGQRWGKSAANGILLPKRMFPQCVCLLPHVFVSLKSKTVPQQIWALSVQQGCPRNTCRGTSVQQLPHTAIHPDTAIPLPHDVPAVPSTPHPWVQCPIAKGYGAAGDPLLHGLSDWHREGSFVIRW